MLTRETFIGPWAGMPVAWTQDNRFDEQTYRGDIARMCEVGVPGVYTGGSTGEFFAMEFDEFKAVAKATIEECKAHGTPVMIGCTSTYTLGVLRRAACAAEMGAQAIQIALPFWYKFPEDRLVPFFREIAAATDGMALSVYETPRVKKVLSVDEHRAIKDAAPNYLMVKSNPGSVGVTIDGCVALSEFINVFVTEDMWAKFCPKGACGSCSSMVYYNPRVIMQLWRDVQEKDWAAVERCCRKLIELNEFLDGRFGPLGYTDSAYDRLGGAGAGFLKGGLNLRGPYAQPTEEHLRELRQWYREHFPEMLVL